MDGTTSSHLRPGENCYKVLEAEKAAVIVDADDYFRFARIAMVGAKRRITLIGWDFDARIAIGDASQDGGPKALGDFILWLVDTNPELEIFLLRWDVGALKSIFRGLTTMVSLARWMAHPRIHTKLDHHHPHGSSHHQKIVVIDECLAFCGGIDMFSERWDTREHRHRDARRKNSNGALYKPWHDATTALVGPVVSGIVEICRDRWRDAGGQPAMEPLPAISPCWPEGLWTHFEAKPLALARTLPELEERTPVHEIEKAYLDQIARARRWIYAESQYFASRRIAEAIASRLREPDGPEIVILNPQSAEGWLEPIAMDTARARLIETLRKIDTQNHFAVYHPFTDGGDPIYVHAKIMIVDDDILHIGSSNMNNRSMRLDTECDVIVEADNDADRKVIADLRNDLLAEHLGCDPGAISSSLAETGSLIATTERLRGRGRTIRPYEAPHLNDVESWLADNEVLDPEGPGEMFESIEKRSLFRRLKSLGQR